ncbi:hypothetical protein UPYG_G00114960 [Umbra pygmaea]|uniref:CCHC-type domain-containing protein n=1 Tax=Umbra pygmaea TaxID=75934 RepID=A0ABD0X4H0_UMBPY
MLAGLDYNHHVHRQARRKADGTIQYGKVYNKKSRKWNLYSVKVEKDYSYIVDLQNAIVRQRLSSEGMPRRRTRRPDDPRQHGVLSGVPAPTTEELLQIQVSLGIEPVTKPKVRYSCTHNGSFILTCFVDKGDRVKFNWIRHDCSSKKNLSTGPVLFLGSHMLENLTCVATNEISEERTSSALHTCRGYYSTVAAFGLYAFVLLTLTMASWDFKKSQKTKETGFPSRCHSSDPVDYGPGGISTTCNLQGYAFIRLDNRLRERRQEKAMRTTGPTTRNTLEPVHQVPTGMVTQSGNSGLSPARPAREEPMQLDRAKLSSTERFRRIQAGECLYCGKLGHFLSTCPVRPKGGARQ